MRHTGYLLVTMPNVPFDSEKLPADKYIREHGFKFSSSLSWMLRYAIDFGYEEIVIYGVHLAHKTEYETQRDSFYYFYGLR